MRTLLSIVLILSLAGCGDSGDSSSGSGSDSSSGSSSSGGDSSSSSSSSSSGSEQPASSFAGTYTGTMNVIARTDTLGNIRETYPFTATVNRDNRLRFQDDDGDFNVTTTVESDGRFQFEFSPDSTVCTGTVSVNGRIVDTRISGNLSGPASCRVGSTTVAGTIDGDFTGSR